jgi:hypothetical protein
MSKWRFDQGRLNYFQIDEIKKIACALAAADGMPKPAAGSDGLRKILSMYSKQPFLPTDYTVWRNYRGVFGCMMLASEIGGIIVATELCKKIASNPVEMDADDYLAHFARNFYYASPVFLGYSTTGQQIFPVVALIKFLISEYLVSGKNYINLDEMASHLIGNDVTGLEDLAFYGGLKANPLGGDADIRQLRELVRFVSQFSFLKWDNPNLYIEVKDKEEIFAIEKSLTPVIRARNSAPGLEVYQLGSGFVDEVLGKLTLKKMDTLEEEFTEGKKVRVTHLRTERSSKLRDMYFSTFTSPQVCNMCAVDTNKRYPWAEHVIELHHLLPLSSPIRVESGKTSLKDLVGLCPSCHRATHKFYSSWFKTSGLRDFGTYSEAQNAYKQAKETIVLS